MGRNRGAHRHDHSNEIDAMTAGDEGRCDCGSALTQCASCAVADWQARIRTAQRAARFQPPRDAPPRDGPRYGNG